jgi:hypothetical protein
MSERGIHSVTMTVDLRTDELGRNLGEALAAALRPTILDCDVLGFDPAELSQPLHESGNPLARDDGVAAPKKPIVGSFVCCPCAASGHAAATPPSSVMNSRRRIAAPKLRGQHCIGSNGYLDRAQPGHQNHCRSAQPMSLEGQKPALPRRSIGVRFALNKQTLTKRTNAVQ